MPAADAMTVISDMRSKANNRARHQAEFAAPPGVDPNGAHVFRRCVGSVLRAVVAAAALTPRATLARSRELAPRRSSVANLTKKRRKHIAKNHKDSEKRAAKALAILDRGERRLEKQAVKATHRQRSKRAWE